MPLKKRESEVPEDTIPDGAIIPELLPPRDERPIAEILAEPLLTPNDRATLVRKRLVSNVLEGQDRAAQSLKMLGDDREVRMWASSEAQVGIIIIAEAPAGIEKLLNMPQIILPEPE